MTIYIPIAVEKELPPRQSKEDIWSESIIFIKKRTLLKGQYSFIDNEFESEGGITYTTDQVTHWLKPILVSDLITHVQNSIAPQRQDLHTEIEISINSFFK